MGLKELENDVMKLSVEERHILSIDAPSDAENLRLWVGEAERRLKELREGAAREVSAEEVFRRVKAAARKALFRGNGRHRLARTGTDEHGQAFSWLWGCHRRSFWPGL